MRYLFIFLALIAVISCSNTDRQSAEIRELSGRQISFPSGYTTLPYSRLRDVDSLLKTDLKVVSYIDDLPCTSCGLKMLRSWIETINEINKDLTYIIVIHTKENNFFSDYVDSLCSKTIILNYDSYKFGEINKLNVMARNKTFLIDKNNRIVLIGEPFNHEKMFLLYQRTIKQLREHGQTNN
jgi:hypothetical protein